MADGNSSSAYNARFYNRALYARRVHNAREFSCQCYSFYLIDFFFLLSHVTPHTAQCHSKESTLLSFVIEFSFLAYPSIFSILKALLEQFFLFLLHCFSRSASELTESIRGSPPIPVHLGFGHLSIVCGLISYCSSLGI